MKAMQSILVLAMVIFTPLCQANDFPTADRVEFVLECMRDHKGVEFELLNKCSCTIDRLAALYKYDDFVEAQTMAKAVTIAGERGSQPCQSLAGVQTLHHIRSLVGFQ